MTNKQKENFTKEYEEMKAIIPHCLIKIINMENESNLTKVEAMRCLIEFDTKYSVTFQ